MLDVLRRSASGWFSKILLAVLIVSFGIWGIADVFRGFGSTTVAEIGGTRITATAFDTVYRRELDGYGRTTGRQLTRDEAVRAGLPSQVLSRLVTDATLSEAARRLRVGLSDDEVVRLITADGSYRTSTGQFDRARFTETLRSNGWSEDDYVGTVRDAGVRRQLEQAVAGPMTAPKVMLEAVNRYRNEERVISYLRLDPATLGTIEAPAPDVLAKFFEERKTAFRAPEYRKLAVVVVDPAAIAKPGDVGDDEARAVYQRSLNRFGEPERRKVERIPFAKAEEAEAALARLKAGTSFDALVAERNLKPEDIDLGLLPKTGFLDPAIGEAAFKLAAAGDVSEVVKGNFATVILRVGEIRPAGQKAFDEVKDQLKAEIALRRAGDDILQIHGQIEDARAGGAKLEEIAKRFGLKAIVVDGVDKSGRTPDGSVPQGLPEAQKVVAAAFESDVGVENNTITVGNNGFLWFDVTAIVPARDRPLAEVEADVVSRWTTEQVRSRLIARSNELAERLKKGESIADVAAAAGLEVMTSPSLKRGEPAEGLSSAVIAAAFAGPEGHVATATGDGDSRVVLVVRDVAEPTFFAEAADLRPLAQQLAGDVQNTLLEQYARQLRADIGVSINQQLVGSLVGVTTNQQ